MLKNQIHRIREMKPAWLDHRVLLFLMIVIVFTMAMTWGEPIPQAAAMQMSDIDHAAPEIGPELNVEAEADALAPEMLANKGQTNGIIFGSLMLVLIIIGTAVSAVYQKAHEM